MPRFCRQLPACRELGKAGGEPQAAHSTSTGLHTGPSPYLFKCISCNRLESLFHINGLLGTGFKVGDVVFTVAPGLCPFCGDLGGQNSITTFCCAGRSFIFKTRPEILNLSSSDLKATALKQNTRDHFLSPDRPSPRARRSMPKDNETTEHGSAPIGTAQHSWGRRSSSFLCTSPASCCNPSTSGQEHAVHRGLTPPGTRNPYPVADNI